MLSAVSAKRDVGTDNCLEITNSQEFINGLKLRRKRRVRRVVTGEHGCPVGDVPFVEASDPVSYNY